MTKIVRLDQLPDAAPAVPVDPALRGGVVSIGNFDGVHRGHSVLLRHITTMADSLRGPSDLVPSVVVVFDPHPAAILRPNLKPPRLTWIERRAELLGRFGIDYLLVCNTTPEFLSLSAKAFFDWLIIDQLDAKAIVEGPNFFFGKGRGGNTDTLSELCAQNHIRCQIVEPDIDDGEMVSSTRIRDAILSASIDQANQWLGVPYRIRGIVTKGEQRGRTIGFPTANMSNIDVVVPAHGVYGGFAWINQQQHIAAIHIGPNPTFDDHQQTKVEVHVLDFSGDLYDETIMVDFVTHVRDIARFDSAVQLSEQLKRDIESIRTQLFLGGDSPNVPPKTSDADPTGNDL